MNKKIVIRRPINGIFLNGFEYVTEDAAGEHIKFFESEESARHFLIGTGYTAEDLQTDLDNGAIDICEWSDDE